MTWPQWLVMALLIFGALIQVTLVARDKDKSAGTVAFVFLWEIVYRVTFAFILHAGGFW